MKGIACVAVILIHVNFPGELRIFVKTVCRFAVPVFFMISGFFFVDSDGKCYKKKTIHKIKHILKLLLFSGIFYIGFNIIWNKLMNGKWSWKNYIIETITYEKIVKFILTNDPFVYSHLRFLLALLYSYVFLLVIVKNGTYPRRIVNSFPILLFYIYALWKNVFNISAAIEIHFANCEINIYKFNCFVLRALPWPLMGMYIRSHKEFFEKINVEKEHLYVIGVLHRALVS